MLTQHWLFTPEAEATSISTIADATKQFPNLPGAADGEFTITDGPRYPVMCWRQSGFSTRHLLSQSPGPFLEIGGPTPRWDDPRWRATAIWGQEYDLSELPGPLHVTNIVPLPEACAWIIGEYAGNDFFQADVTRLPLRTGSMAAVFCRGLSIVHGAPPEVYPPDYQAKSTVIRLAAFKEVVRVLQPDGLFYLGGATAEEIACLRLFGLELRMYRGDTEDHGQYVQFAETVYTKPRLNDR
ncbi:MAG: class I SAM-dependent methyltransferase [Candidatus Kerfeldbacteria bacterium]|nr:class I SAM-dependent methyltransferase [Candidatus Kerfeldbacteria bacterium]